MTNFYNIAVRFPLVNSILVYSDIDMVDSNLKQGQLVKVPLGRRNEMGCVLSHCPENELEVSKEKIKSISEVISHEIHLSDGELQFFSWVAKYYHYSLGQLIFDSLPKIMKRPQKLERLDGENLPIPFTPNRQQQYILDQILSERMMKFSKTLIHGITGSGKSLIYLRLMQEVVNKGESVLFLLPEINLTPQFLKFFSEHLDCAIYSYHSSLSHSQKFGLWKLLQEDESPKVIVGVRSSIFLPLKNCGMIIVDEEHDSSFKQEDRCPYNARDLAIKKASLKNIPVVLGSATPTLESFYNFKKSQNYFALTDRVGEGKLPLIELVDLKEEKENNPYWPLCDRTIQELTKVLENSEQALIFVNRLGFATFLQCSGCGHNWACPNCSVNLKFYKAKNKLTCPHCELSQSVPEICPECSNMKLMQKGFGTEKVEERLREIFPMVNIERFDRDEINNFEKLKDKLSRFKSGDIDLLVGTQMLSKGHNFEKVNLVVILGIDSQLNFPDFRSNERVYQQITQVSGRAGRFGPNGRVLIQTFNPQGDVFSHLLEHHFDSFYQEEVEIRNICHCPPFYRLCQIMVTDKSQIKAIETSKKLTLVMKDMARQHFSSVMVLGPKPATVEKRVNKFTWIILLKSNDHNHLHNLLQSVLGQNLVKSGPQIKVDLDPQHLF